MLIELPPEDGTFRPRLQALLEGARPHRAEPELRNACAAARYLLDLVAARGQDDPLVHAVRGAAARRLRCAEEAAASAGSSTTRARTLREELRCFLRTVDGFAGQLGHSRSEPGREV